MVVYEGHRSVKGEYLYNQVDKNLNFQKHTHCNYEIVFCLGGCLVCEVGNKKYEQIKQLKFAIRFGTAGRQIKNLQRISGGLSPFKTAPRLSGIAA